MSDTIRAIEIDPVTGEFVQDLPHHTAGQTGDDYPHIVTILCPDGFYTPRWDGQEWIESTPQSEIDAIKAGQAFTRVREIRKQEYAKQIGKDPGDVVNTIGDVLDALIKAHYGDTTELDAMAAKIQQIKADHPIPS